MPSREARHTPIALYDPRRGDINKAQTRCASFKFDCLVKIITFGRQSQTKAKGSLTDFLASPPIISPQSSHLHQLTISAISRTSAIDRLSSSPISLSRLSSSAVDTYVHTYVCVYILSPLLSHICYIYIFIFVCT